MNEPSRRRYVIHDNGQYLYYLTREDFGHRDGWIEKLELRADETPMTPLRVANYKGGWYAADHRATEILVQVPAKKVPVAYVLKDPAMESVKYPGRLSPEQWQALGGDENRWQYDAENRDEPAAWEVLAVDSGDWALIEGTVAPKFDEDALPWIPALLPGLMERTEYHHMMPGHIPGLAAHVGKCLERKLGAFRVRYDRDGRSAGVQVELLVPFEQPLTRWQANIGRNGQTLKSGKNVERTVTRTMRLPVPAVMPGETYAAALAAWDEAVEFWLGVVQASAAGAAKACNHCSGHGYVGGDVFTEYDVPKGVF